MDHNELGYEGVDCIKLATGTCCTLSVRDIFDMHDVSGVDSTPVFK
jgi:hypothetical protein